MRCTISQIYLDKVCYVFQAPIAAYSVETPDDGQKICPKHVEYFIKINYRNSASRWLLL